MSTFEPPPAPSVRSLRYALALALAADGRVGDALDSLEAAITEPGRTPGEADIRHELGRLYEGSDIAIAFREHVTAALVAPERSEALLAPALRLLETRPSLAADSVLTLLQSRMDRGDSLFEGSRATGVALLGRAALARRDFTEASRLFELGRSIDPSSSDALAGLAEVARRQGRRTDAAALLDSALQAASKQNDRERAGRYGGALVEVHIDDDHYEQADAVLARLDSLGAQDDAGQLSRAIVLLAQNEPERAALIAGQLVDTRLAAAALRVQAQALTVMAVRAGDDGDYAPAEAAARHSAELEATSTDALLVLAQVLIESNGEVQTREGLRLLASVTELLDSDTRLPQVLRRALAGRPHDVDLCLIAASLIGARRGADRDMARWAIEAREQLDVSLTNGSLARRSAAGALLLDGRLKSRAGDPVAAAAAWSSAGEKLRDEQQWTDSLAPLRSANDVADIATTRWMLADSLLMIATSTYPFDQQLVAEGTEIWDGGLAMAAPTEDWRWVYLTRGHLASARAARADGGGQRGYWEALCWFEAALVADPQRTSVWTRIAEAANLGYLYEYGIDALEGALALEPNDVAAIAEHAALLVNTGRVPAALESVKAARSLDDLGSTQTYLDKIESFCHTLQRNYTDALRLVDGVLAASPKDQWSLFTRFWVRRQLHLDDADTDLALIEQALAEDPDNHREHANLHLLRGRYRAALERLDRLDDLTMRDPNNLGTKVICFAALGEVGHRDLLDDLVRCTRYVPEVSSLVDHSIPWILDHVTDQAARTMLLGVSAELERLVSRLATGRTLVDDLDTLSAEAARFPERGAWGRLLVTMIRARQRRWMAPDVAPARADLPPSGQVLCDRYLALVETRRSTGPPIEPAASAAPSAPGSSASS